MLQVVQARRWTTFSQFVLTTNDFSKSPVGHPHSENSNALPGIKTHQTLRHRMSLNELSLSFYCWWPSRHWDRDDFKTQTEFGNQMSSLLEKILWCLYTYFQFFPCSGWPKKLVFFPSLLVLFSKPYPIYNIVIVDNISLLQSWDR